MMSDRGRILWGVATSDHQSEAFDEHLRDIRDEWEVRIPQTPRGRATDFWHRYPEDLALARGLGCTAFRFSVSWARVEPEPGEFNHEALDHYRNLARAIREAGMEPLLTLHHFTWPLHVEARGGMTADDFPEWFRAYAREVATVVGEHVRYWVTFNEPTLLPYGYVKPWWDSRYSMPPGRADRSPLDQLEDVARLIPNLFRANAAARDEIRRLNPIAQVGANPFLLGLPGWLQGLMDWALLRQRDPKRWRQRELRAAHRKPRALGGADVVLALLTDTAERERHALFSEPYYLTHLSVLVPHDSGPTSPTALAGLPVAVVRSTTAEHAARWLLPESTLVPAGSAAEALRAVELGTAQGWLTDHPLAVQREREQPGRFRVVPCPEHQEPYAAAVAGGDQDLLTAVNECVRRFVSTGELQRCVERHGLPATLPLRVLDEAAAPSQGPSDGALAAIRRRGHLRVAVRGDVPGFSAPDPSTGVLCGLEVDLAREFARTVLGNADRVEFSRVTPSQRIAALRTPWRSCVEAVQRLLALFTMLLNTNWWHLGMAGRLPEFLCPAGCSGQQDYAGLDYYWGIDTLHVHRVLRLIDSTQQRFSRAPVWPGGLRRILGYHARLFPGLPILVIENGCVEEADGTSRAEYLRRHTRELLEARRKGVPVEGYFCWSITTNREWGLPQGPDSDFGLYRIDLDRDPSLARVETESARDFRRIVAEATEADSKSTG